MAETHRSNPLVRQFIRHVRTTEALTAFARWSGVSSDVADGVIANLRGGNVVALLVSGAQSSGKDSVCQPVLHRSGVTDYVQCRVAHAIRAEMSEIISIVATSPDPAKAVANVAGIMQVSDESAELYSALFFDATRDPAHGIDVHERTETMRRALQWHGAEGRAEEPGYWVKRTYRDVLPNLAAGRSVYLSDGRFPGEVDGGRTSGALCVRLWVPEEMRIARILKRDGFVPSVATLRHPGETALDGYWGLDAEIDNTQSLDATVACISGLLDEHRDLLTRID